MNDKILIVDDERTVIEQVSTLLKSFGYQTDFIPHPKILFKKLERGLPGLILLDINMPQINGMTLLKELKENEEYKNIPVIMMTGDSNEETLENCFNLGADDYITKPIKELVLKSRVKNIIEKEKYIREIEVQKELVEQKNKDITKSINYASYIQQALLPDIQAIKSVFDDCFVFYKPRDIVSGDFYWFSEFDTKVVIAAIDCTGHGVPGAFMSMLGDAFLKNIINTQGVTDPGTILSLLNKTIRIALKQDSRRNYDGMDISLCLYDKENKTIEFAGAYNELLHINNGEIEIIKGNRCAIGGKQIKKNQTYNTNKLDLKSSSTFYIFSDGYPDQFGGADNRKYMKKSFRELLLKIHTYPMDEQKQQLEEELQNWQGSYKQVDDMLIIGFKIDAHSKSILR